MTLVARARHWWPILPLLGLLGASYWLNQQVQPEAAKPDRSKVHAPDALMTNFSALKFNEQGAPRFILAAKQLRHYPDDDSTEVESPHLTTLSSDRSPTHSEAKRGLITHKGDEVLLHEQVKVWRDATSQQQAMTLQTEYLRVIPERDWAETNLPVTLTNTSTTVNAVGLEMDNHARTIKLLAQVRSEHAPNTK